MTRRSVATRYARALFDVALREADPGQVEQELRAFSDAVDANDALKKLFERPGVPPARKRAVVEALLAHAGGYSAPLQKLLLLLAERDRLGWLSEVLSSYQGRLMAHRRIVSAEIVSAVPLPPERVDALAGAIARTVGQQVSVTTRVDNGILGGVVAKVGTLVYDASVVRQLQRMKESMMSG